MPKPDRRNALDHVVVMMFENRSFDNLLFFPGLQDATQLTDSSVHR